MSTRKFVHAGAFLAALLLLGAADARAYIDPGTGMTFISGIGAFIMGIFAFAFGAIVMTFKKWKGAIKSLFSRKKEGGDHPL